MTNGRLKIFLQIFRHWHIFDILAAYGASHGSLQLPVLLLFMYPRKLCGSRVTAQTRSASLRRYFLTKNMIPPAEILMLQTSTSSLTEAQWLHSLEGWPTSVSEVLKPRSIAQWIERSVFL